jgi:hypothetical protein
MDVVIRLLVRAAVLAAILLSAIAAPAVVIAGDDDTDDDDDNRFGAWLYAGSPGDIDDQALIQFGSLEREDDQDDINEFDLSAVGATSFWEGDGDVHQTVEQLLAEPHVIVVRSENDVEAPVIAMGVVEGTPNERGELTISLQPVEDSGYAGLALFEPDDDDDDDTDVDLVIWEGEPVAPGTPAA